MSSSARTGAVRPGGAGRGGEGELAPVVSSRARVGSKQQEDAGGTVGGGAQGPRTEHRVGAETHVHSSPCQALRQPGRLPLSHPPRTKPAGVASIQPAWPGAAGTGGRSAAQQAPPHIPRPWPVLRRGAGRPPRRARFARDHLTWQGKQEVGGGLAGGEARSGKLGVSGLQNPRLSPPRPPGPPQCYSCQSLHSGEGCSRVQSCLPGRAVCKTLISQGDTGEPLPRGLEDSSPPPPPPLRVTHPLHCPSHQGLVL